MTEKNNPAEKRDVRGNLIRPAVVEPEQKIESEYVESELKVSVFDVPSLEGVNTTGSLQVTEIDTEIDKDKTLSVYVRDTSTGSERIFSGAGFESDESEALVEYYVGGFEETTVVTLQNTGQTSVSATGLELVVIHF